MSTVYDEGPYKNWTAVHFLAGITYYWNELSVGAGVDYGNFFARDANDDVLFDYPIENFQAIITGVDSGHSIDLRSIPTTYEVSTSIGWSLGNPTPSGGCISELVSGILYEIPSGSSLYGVTSTFEGAILKRSTGGGFSRPMLVHKGTWTLEGSDPTWFCRADNNNQPLGFIDDEQVLLTNPDE